MTDKHVAYNLITGEVITTQQGKYLKKLVRKAGGKGWIFSHAGLNGMADKVRTIAK